VVTLFVLVLLYASREWIKKMPRSVALIVSIVMFSGAVWSFAKFLVLFHSKHVGELGGSTPTTWWDLILTGLYCLCFALVTASFSIIAIFESEREPSSVAAAVSSRSPASLA
jgi:hypothetical protein